MSRPCTVCTHSAIAAIDSELRGGRPARRVASDFGLSRDATVRHARNHLVRDPAPVVPASGDPLDQLIAGLRTRALAGDPSAAREYRLALSAQVGKNAEAPTYDVLADPEWIRLRSILLEALRPYPEARLAVADAIRAEL